MRGRCLGRPEGALAGGQGPRRLGGLTVATLHLVNKAAAWADCEPLLSPEDTVLLIEDGVYAALQAPPDGCQMQALEPDVRARGLFGRLPPSVGLASFDDFVGLVVGNDRVVSWTC